MAQPSASALDPGPPLSNGFPGLAIVVRRQHGPGGRAGCAPAASGPLPRCRVAGSRCRTRPSPSPRVSGRRGRRPRRLLAGAGLSLPVSTCTVSGQARNMSRSPPCPVARLAPVSCPRSPSSPTRIQAPPRPPARRPSAPLSALPVTRRWASQLRVSILRPLPGPWRRIVASRRPA